MNGYIFPKEVISTAREKLAAKGVEGVETKDLLILIDAHLSEEMEDLRATLHEEMEGLRATIIGEVDGLKSEMRDLKKSFKVIGWWVATACTGIAGSLIAGLIIELLKK